MVCIDPHEKDILWNVTQRLKFGVGSLMRVMNIVHLRILISRPGLVNDIKVLNKICHWFLRKEKFTNSRKLFTWTEECYNKRRHMSLLSLCSSILCHIENINKSPLNHESQITLKSLKSLKTRCVRNTSVHYTNQGNTYENKRCIPSQNASDHHWMWVSVDTDTSVLRQHLANKSFSIESTHTF